MFNNATKTTLNVTLITLFFVRLIVGKKQFSSHQNDLPQLSRQYLLIFLK
jgi:hypothetical protein